MYAYIAIRLIDYFLSVLICTVNNLITWLSWKSIMKNLALWNIFLATNFPETLPNKMKLKRIKFLILDIKLFKFPFSQNGSLYRYVFDFKEISNSLFCVRVHVVLLFFWCGYWNLLPKHLHSVRTNKSVVFHFFIIFASWEESQTT